MDEALPGVDDGPGMLYVSRPLVEDVSMEPSERLPKARHAYARTLELVVPVAFVIALLTFILYVTGILEPLVTLPAAAKAWGMAAHEAHRFLGLEPGWGWLSKLRYADMLCLLSLALLATATPLACAVALIQYIRRREWIPSVIAFLQICVLALAMSGLVVVE